MSTLFKAIDSSLLPANYRATLRMFASFSPDGDGRRIFPALKTVAKRLGRKRSMVQKHVRWLIANGLMKPAPGYEDRQGGWVLDKRCGRATEFIIDIDRVLAWTPGTAVLGDVIEQGSITPGTPVPGRPGTPVLGPRGTSVPPSLDFSFEDKSKAFAGEQRPVHAVENQLASSPTDQAEQLRAPMLDVDALMSFGRSVLLAQNEKGALDETALRVHLRMHALAGGAANTAELGQLVRTVALELLTEHVVALDAAAATESGLGGESTNPAGPVTGSHNTRHVPEFPLNAPAASPAPPPDDDLSVGQVG